MGKRRIFSLALILFACLSPPGFSKEPETVPARIVILDQNGRVAPDMPFQPTGQTVDVKVGFGGTNFNPSTVNIVVGDTVRWTWFSFGHNVRSGTPCTGPNSQFCSPNDINCTTNPTSNTNATYSHTFNQAGTYSYYCSVHCDCGMTGTVNVTAPFVNITSVVRSVDGHCLISGLTVPNLTLHIESSPDLVTAFGPLMPGTATANNTGIFQYDDAGAVGLPMRFYRVTYP